MSRATAGAMTLAVISSTSLVAQETRDPAALPEWASGSLVEVPVDELTIRLVPLDLETLELLCADVIPRVRVLKLRFLILKTCLRPQIAEQTHASHLNSPSGRVGL